MVSFFGFPSNSVCFQKEEYYSSKESDIKQVIFPLPTYFWDVHVHALGRLLCIVKNTGVTCLECNYNLCVDNLEYSNFSNRLGNKSCQMFSLVPGGVVTFKICSWDYLGP